MSSYSNYGRHGEVEMVIYFRNALDMKRSEKAERQYV